MKTVSQCTLCLLKIAHTAADAVAAAEPERLAVVQAALSVLARDDFSRIPPAIARDVLHEVGRVLGTDDPFAEIKKEHDAKATAIVDSWAPSFMEGSNGNGRLERAIRAALAGNGMDLATIPDRADPSLFAGWLDAPWARNDLDLFEHALDATDDVLYLCDNAGEIAFDKVLVRELLDRGKRVTVAVKGGPALNDATMEDALAVGMDRLEGGAGKVRLISTGQPNMGVDLSNASAEFRKAFQEAGMVAAKGQANLESLHDCGREVFFITLIKCTHVSNHYQLPKGSAMLYRGGLESGVDQG